MSSDVRAIGARIAHVRLGRKLSQIELAKRATVDQSQLSKIERGEIALPRVQTLERIAAGLGVSYFWLATGYGDMLASEPAPEDG